jgi:BolA family transcriptional regulator, general stress-responsive regulator
MSTPAANTNRVERIRALLTEQLRATAVDVIDDSHLHAGHAGARDGRGHFRVHIVSEAFSGLRALQRHQLVYRSLGEMMQNDIHALSIVAHAPGEFSSE